MHVFVLSTAGMGGGAVQPGVQPLGAEHVQRGLPGEGVRHPAHTHMLSLYTHTHVYTQAVIQNPEEKY